MAELVLKAVDPRHGRRLPDGRELARALKRLFKRQLAYVLAELRRRPGATPALAGWTAPMAAQVEPYLLPYYRDGYRDAARRLRRRVSERSYDAQGVPGNERGLSGSYADEPPTIRREGAGVPGRSGEPGMRAARRRPRQVGRPYGYAATRLVKDEGAPGADLLAGAFDVFNPKILDAVRTAAFAFCDSTNATATRSLDAALAELRQALAAGLAEGEALSQLTRRVQALFADPNRAFLIAAPESSRAVHAGQVLAAKDSGVCSGLRWLASADACKICLPLDGKEVAFDQSFAVIGRGVYATIYYPPAHPSCQCTVTEVLAI